MKKAIYWVLIGIFSVMFLVSAFMVGRYLINSHQYKQQLEDLQNLHTLPQTRPSVSLRQPTEATEPQPSTYPSLPVGPTDPSSPVFVPTEPAPRPSNPSGSGILPELESLYQMNKDMVGWIYIPGTNINNPVMQRKQSKDYYLHRDFHKNYDENGSIYVRETCDVFAPTDVLTLYGHSMFNGNMFAHVLKYTNKGFFNDHQLIYFDTLYERHAYQVVCVFRTSADPGQGFTYHLYDDFADEAEYQAFIQTARQLAIHDSGIPVRYGDKFILLSTCEDVPIKNGRLVVLAVRID